METNNNDIDKLFRDTLDGHSSAYIPGAWERMDTMLNDGSKGLLRENIHRYVLASVVSTIILAGSVIAYVSGYNNNTGTFADSGNIAQQPVATENTANTTVNNTTDNSSAQNNIAETATTVTTTTATAPKANTHTTAAKHNTVAAAATSTTKQNVIVSTNETTDNETTVNTEVIEQPTTDIVIQEEALPVVTSTESTYEKRTYLQDALGAKNLQIDIAQLDNTTIDTETKQSNETFNKAEFERVQRERKRNLTKLNYGLLIGGNFNSVLSNTGASGWGKGILAGIYFAKNSTTSPRWGASIGLNYIQSTGNSIGRTITQTTYFFEKTTTSYYLLTKSFENLQLPINISYTAGLNHRLSMGIVASYLINSQTEVAQQKEKTGEFVSNTKTEKGVYEDMDRFGYGIMAGYEYKLPGIYSIGLCYNKQFSSITNSSFFNDKKQIPANIQVYLKLNLTR
jgi:hypothetical protein